MREVVVVERDAPARLEPQDGPIEALLVEAAHRAQPANADESARPFLSRELDDGAEDAFLVFPRHLLGSAPWGERLWRCSDLQWMRACHRQPECAGEGRFPCLFGDAAGAQPALDVAQHRNRTRDVQPGIRGRSPETLAVSANRRVLKDLLSRDKVGEGTLSRGLIERLHFAGQLLVDLRPSERPVLEYAKNRVRGLLRLAGRVAGGVRVISTHPHGEQHALAGQLPEQAA